MLDSLVTAFFGENPAFGFDSILQIAVFLMLCCVVYRIWYFFRIK